MAARSELGAADLSDEELAAVAAALLGEDCVELLDTQVESVDYALEAITTGGRWWVSGSVGTPSGPRQFRVFVKLVRSWTRSPMFAELPEHIRDFAAASVPWRTEALVYRSDLAARLPEGLRMPSALRVEDLDDLSIALWLEPVDVDDRPWDLERYAHAAHLLGRLAGSRRVAPLGSVGQHPFTVRDYFHGRYHQVRPMLWDEDLWHHPLLAAYDAELLGRMRAADRLMADYVEELAAMPRLPAHGDACPNNLLSTAGHDGFVLIDFGFWCTLPVGFDLGQLLVGEVQLGRQPAAQLAATEAAVLPAYVAGLRAEGREVDQAVVRRGHALHLLLWSGLSAFPFEHLTAEPSEALHRLAADRAELSRFSLDLVEDASSRG